MICRSCSLDKHANEFRKWRRQCRDCLRKVNAQRAARDRRANPVKAKLRDRLRYRLNPERRVSAISGARLRMLALSPSARLAKVQNWRAQNPQKYRAQTAVGNALRDGKLTKGACVMCGTTSMVVGHHHDYMKPLDVTWLCRTCHGAEHWSINMASLLAQPA